MNYLCTDEFITKAVNEYSDTVYRIALNITKNPDDAFDVCQDVFVRLIKNREKIKDGEHLKAWLLRAAVNCARSNRTQVFKRNTVLLDEHIAGEISYELNETNLFEYVMRLPEKYSTVIHLFYYEEMKISQIAKILGITQSAVKSRLVRGRKRLKAIIEKENFYD